MDAKPPALLSLLGLMLVWPSAFSDRGPGEHTAAGVSAYNGRCERGYYGPRCAHIELVFQPMKEEQLVLVGVCVVLLIIGLSGAFYFFYKWYRGNRAPHPQKRQGYVGVSRA
ncbi:hypothetical protein CRUP_036339 [Coryphaenoides rupestris]|nr:hypothetical protein CRUP_036339 [Coryphaenoides rupestris]